MTPKMCIANNQWFFQQFSLQHLPGPGLKIEVFAVEVLYVSPRNQPRFIGA